MDKHELINGIIDVEGGFVNNEDDSGGATCWGVTQKKAAEYGYTGDMRDFPRDLAFQIYASEYWDSVAADDVIAMAPRVAEELVDTAINAGPPRALMFLQRVLNVMNVKGSLYRDITVDGAIGPATLGALAEYLSYRKEAELVKALNCLQGAFYIELAERREKDESFVYGWLANRVVL